MPESPGLYLRAQRRWRTSSASPISTRCRDPAGIASPRPGRRQPGRPSATMPAARCPRGSASASHWRGRCSATRRCCSSTSRPRGLDPVATRDVHELIDELRQRGVTIFLTTHRLEEAERLCDRVAILNTTLRTIGRPDELRDRLFARTLDVRTARPAAESRTGSSPASPAVDAWRQDGPAGYVLDRVGSRRSQRRPSPGRWCRPAPTCCQIRESRALARGRLPRADRRGRRGGAALS